MTKAIVLRSLTLSLVLLTVAACDDGSSGGSKKRRNNYNNQYVDQQLPGRPFNGQKLDNDGIDRTDDNYYAPLRGERADNVAGQNALRGHRGSVRGDVTTQGRLVKVRRADGSIVTVREGSMDPDKVKSTSGTIISNDGYNSSGESRQVYIVTGSSSNDQQIYTNSGDVYTVQGGRVIYNDIGDRDYVQQDIIINQRPKYDAPPADLINEIARYIVGQAFQYGQDIQEKDLVESTAHMFTLNDDNAPTALGLLNVNGEVQELSRPSMKGVVPQKIIVTQGNYELPGATNTTIEVIANPRDAGFVDLYQDDTFEREIKSGGHLEDTNMLIHFADTLGNQLPRNDLYKEYNRQRTGKKIESNNPSLDLMASIKDVMLLVNRPANYKSIGSTSKLNFDPKQIESFGEGRLVIKLDFDGKEYFLRAGKNAGARERNSDKFRDDQKMNFELKTTTRGSGADEITFTRYSSFNSRMLLYTSAVGGDHYKKDDVRFDVTVECFPEPGAGSFSNYQPDPEKDCTKAVIRLTQLRKVDKVNGKTERENWIPCKFAAIIYRQQDYKIIFNENDFLKLRTSGDNFAMDAVDRGVTNLSRSLWNNTHITLANNYATVLGDAVMTLADAPSIKYTRVHSWAVPYGKSEVKVLFQLRTKPGQNEEEMQVSAFAAPLKSFNQSADLSNRGIAMTGYALDWNNLLERKTRPLLMQGFSNVTLKYNDPTTGNLILDFNNGSARQRLYMQPWVLR